MKKVSKIVLLICSVVGAVAAFVTVFAYFTGWANIYDIPLLENKDSPPPIENSPIIENSPYGVGSVASITLSI